MKCVLDTLYKNSHMAMKAQLARRCEQNSVGFGFSRLSDCNEGVSIKAIRGIVHTSTPRAN